MKLTQIAQMLRHLRLDRWNVFYCCVLQNLNAHKKLQPNCKTYWHIRYT